MNAKELNDVQLDQLKWNLFYQCLDDGSMIEIFGRELDFPDEITDDHIHRHFEGVYFVEEDFSSNI